MATEKIPGEGLRLDDSSTREDVIEALMHLRADAARMTCADPRWGHKHSQINSVLTILDTLQPA